MDGKPITLSEARAKAMKIMADAEESRLMEATMAEAKYHDEIAALQAEIERLRSELKDSQHAASKARAEVERLRKAMNAKYWEGIRDDNTKLRKRIESLEAAIREAQEKCEQYWNAPIAAPEAHAAFSWIHRTLEYALQGEARLRARRGRGSTASGPEIRRF